MRPPGKYWLGHVLDPLDPPTDERGYVWEPTQDGQMMCTKAWDLTAHERLAALLAKMPPTMTFSPNLITESPSPLPSDSRFTFVRFTHPLPCGGVVQVDRCLNGPGDWPTERVRSEAVEQLRRAYQDQPATTEA